MEDIRFDERYDDEYNEETKRYKHIAELGTDSLTDYWYKNAWWGKYY